MKNNMKRVAAMFVMLALLVSGITTVAFASGTKTFVTTATCYMRVNPDKTSTKIATFKKGKELVATDSEKDSRGVTWYYGSCEGKVGWVSSKNLKEKSSSGGSSSKSASYKKYAIITGSCNIRKSPSLDGKKLGVSDVGQYYSCSGAEYDNRGVVWYKIKYKGNTAWVSSKYAKTSNSAPTATPKPIDYSSFKAAEYYVVVTASQLNLRYEPSTDAKVIGSYEAGDVLYAMRSNGTWMQVLDESANKSGYMSAKYLEKYSASSVSVDDDDDDIFSTTAGTFEGLQMAVPNAALIDAPAGSKNVVYTWETLANGVTVAEVEFNVEGVDYELRAAYCASESAIANIDAIETVPELNESAAMHVVMSADGSAAVAHYYSAADRTQYSLVGPGAMNGSLVENMANTLFNAVTTPSLVFTSAA